MIFSRARRLASSKQSPYPLLPFHSLRVFQILSALITSSILCYFVWHLRDEGFPVPWTFIFLLTAALLTIPLFIISQYLHTTAPHQAPKRSLFFLNLPLSVIWIVGLACLCWNLSYTLGHHCGIAQWRNEAGIMVCRMYKALAAFAVTGTAATLGAAFLDWKVWRGDGRGTGGYGMMRLPGESKKRGESPPQSDGAVNREHGFVTTVSSTTTGGDDQRADLRGGALWDSDQRGLTRPWKAMRTMEMKDFGYAVPEGQTSYAGDRGPSMDIADR